MEALKEVLSIDIRAFVISLVLIAGAIEYCTGLFGKIVKKLGLETKWMRQRREEHELLLTTANQLKDLRDKECEDVNQSILHDQAIRESVDELGKKVDTLTKSLCIMKESHDSDKRAEYRDRIGQCYRFYQKRKDENGVIKWNSMEKEALRGLIIQYEAHGGDNSFVHETVQPEMETWILVDE